VSRLYVQIVGLGNNSALRETTGGKTVSTLEPQVSQLITLEEAAKQLTLKVWSVRELVRTGKLRAVRTGGTEENPRGIRTTPEAIAEYQRSLPAFVPVAKGGAA
jgi:excisionase family DNA binding protein